MRYFSTLILLLIMLAVVFPTTSSAQGGPPSVRINSVTPPSSTPITPVQAIVNYTASVSGMNVYCYVDNVQVGILHPPAGSNNWVTPALAAGTHSLKLTCPGGSSSVNYTVLAAWDWTQDVVYDLYYNGASGFSHATARLPWFNNACPPYISVGLGAYGLDQLDMYPSQGWSLLHKDFGTSTVAAQGWPWFVLYNRYRGIVRVFFWNDMTAEHTYGLMTLNINGQNSTPLFTGNNGLKPYTNDYPANSLDNSTLSAIMPILPTQWCMADFTLTGYDEAIGSKYSTLTFWIYGVDTTHVSLSGTMSVQGLIGPAANSMNIQGAATGSDLSTVLSTVTKDVKDVNHLWSELSGAVSSWAPSWYKSTMSDLLQATSGGIPALIPGIGQFAGFVNDFLGVVTGGGGGNQASVSTPISLSGTLSLSGAMQTVRQSAMGNLPVPGSLAAGSLNGTGDYISPLGIFNMVAKPNLALCIKYTDFQYAGSDGYGPYYDEYGDWYLGIQAPIQMRYNPVPGLTVVSAQAYISEPDLAPFQIGPFTQYHDISSLANIVFQPLVLRHQCIANHVRYPLDGPYGIGSLIPVDPIHMGPTVLGVLLKCTYSNSRTGAVDTAMFTKTYPLNNVGDTTVYYRTILSQSVAADMTEEEVQAQGLPLTSALLQNYPNPFNPSTQIPYRLSDVSKVRLLIYDVLGREVADLVNAYQAPGQYSVTWNASNVATGVYFARIVISSSKGQNVTQAKKLNLMK